jgi:tetratricopeptide (TPR) repeat protein
MRRVEFEDALARGRAAFEARAWSAAHEALAQAEIESPLEPEDLVRLGTAAELTGRDAGDVLSRAHRAFLARADPAGAARCAYWLAMRLFNEGEYIRGGGWLARARRLLEEVPRECAEAGLLLTADARGMLEEGNVTLAATTFEQARQIGQRFGEADLVAVALLGLASCRVRSGPPAEGLACLDEVMIAVEAGEVSPIVSGIMYCAVINLCFEVFDLRRAQEWTAGLTRWCAEQPDLVPFRGECQIHRAQVLQLHGAWPAAMDVAESVADEHAPRSRLVAIGPAFYQKAELHRLRGDFSRADEAYRDASRWGYMPEPGLAQMRLAQGQPPAAAKSIARALEEASQRSARARLLPAYVEIMLVSGEIDRARTGADELSSLAAELDAPFIAACAAQASFALRSRSWPTGAAVSDRLSSRQFCGKTQRVTCIGIWVAKSAEIAEKLCNTLNSVQDYLKPIFDNVGVRSRRELVPPALTRPNPRHLVWKRAAHRPSLSLTKETHDPGRIPCRAEQSLSAVRHDSP